MLKPKLYKIANDEEGDWDGFNVKAKQVPFFGFVDQRKFSSPFLVAVCFVEDSLVYH